MDDSLTAICADLLQLRDEIADTTFRPPADEICARLTLIASRIDALSVIPLPDARESDATL